MMLISTSLLFTSVVLTLVLCQNPMTLGVSILILATIVASLSAQSCSSWFGFALFVIFVGSLMVMFAYFIALTPNQQLHMLPVSMMCAMLYSAVVILTSSPTTFNYSTISMFKYQPKPTAFIYSTMTTPTLIILATILFLALILVVKISKCSDGPLRSFNNF